MPKKSFLESIYIYNKAAKGLRKHRDQDRVKVEESSDSVDSSSPSSSDLKTQENKKLKEKREKKVRRPGPREVSNIDRRKIEQKHHHHHHVTEEEFSPSFSDSDLEVDFDSNSSSNSDYDRSMGSYEDLDAEYDFDQSVSDTTLSSTARRVHRVPRKHHRHRSKTYHSILRKATSEEVLTEKRKRFLVLVDNEDLVGLLEFAEAEKSDLYDYVFRMTGRCESSEKYVTEMGSTLETYYKKLKSYEDLRIFLFILVRHLAAREWASSTVKLENSKYKGYLSYREDDYISKMQRVEKKFQSISKNWIKEALLLKYRYKFSDSEASKIMAVTKDNFRNFIQTGCQTIKSTESVSQSELEDMILKFPEYEFSSGMDITTQALSYVMGNLKKESKYGSGYWKLMLKILACVLVLTGVYYLGKYGLSIKIVLGLVVIGLIVLIYKRFFKRQI